MWSRGKEREYLATEMRMWMRGIMWKWCYKVENSFAGFRNADRSQNVSQACSVSSVSQRAELWRSKISFILAKAKLVYIVCVCVWCVWELMHLTHLYPFASCQPGYSAISSHSWQRDITSSFSTKLSGCRASVGAQVTWENTEYRMSHTATQHFPGVIFAFLVLVLIIWKIYGIYTPDHVATLFDDIWRGYYTVYSKGCYLIHLTHYCIFRGLQALLVAPFRADMQNRRTFGNLVREVALKC